MKVLITGVAGFIGFHLARHLSKNDISVVAIDNINEYYDKRLKLARLKNLGIDTKDVNRYGYIKSINYKKLLFYKGDLRDKKSLDTIFKNDKPNYVCHLAAQAGVRYSLTNPYSYIDNNIYSFLNLLECARNNNIRHLVYASSSSVYGLNKKIPFSPSDNVDHPISLYAVSKKSNELMAHTYSHLFEIPTTGIRFFTVYGPWGRPDMALYKFVDSIINNEEIEIFNNGYMKRDFTYIDDIIHGIDKILKKIPVKNESWNYNMPDPSSSLCPYKIYNLGSGNPISLTNFIFYIEEILGKQAIKKYLPIQPGDVEVTYSDNSKLIDEIGFKPNTDVRNGIKAFIEWYKKYNNKILKNDSEINKI